MASISIERDTIVGMDREPLPESSRYVVHCPMHKSLVRVNVCEECPHFEGLARVDRSGVPEQDMRIGCTWGTMRAIRLVKREPFVACPLTPEFRLVTLDKCRQCELHNGIDRQPRGFRDRLLGWGIPQVHCRHAVRRHFERLA